MSRKNEIVFKNFISENLNRSYAFAYTLVKNPQDAEDIVHDSVVKGMKNIGRLKDTSKIKPWFYRIISNSAFTMLKRQNRILPVDDSILEQTLEEPAKDASNMNFQEMIAFLPPELRAVIVLRFFEDMTIKDAANVLEINENTAKTRLYKALKLLKADMEDWDE